MPHTEHIPLRESAEIMASVATGDFGDAHLVR